MLRQVVTFLHADETWQEEPHRVLSIAFDVGESNLDIPRLLEVDDVVSGRADERSIMTYVSFLHRLFKDDSLTGGQIRRFSQKLAASAKVGYPIYPERVHA